MDTLWSLVSDGSNWWTDLLKLWRPSGCDSNEDGHGLRLALRDKGIDFYRLGQRVAEITLLRNGELYGRINSKYVWPDAEAGYVYFADTRTRSPILSTQRVSYDGQMSSWAEAAAEHGKSDRGASEKEFVDDLARYNSVLDLEATLPWWSGGKVSKKGGKCAVRVDLVAIDQRGDVADLVFWEAKQSHDGRTKTSKDDANVEVIEQLRFYREFLLDSDRRRAVETAYVATCCYMSELHKMATSRHVIPPLDHAIETIAETQAVAMDPEPRLVVGVSERADRDRWEYHAARLRLQGIFVLTVDKNDLRLRRDRP